MRHKFDRWEVQCLPADGARLSMLRYAGRDLLTAPPARFRLPRQDLGEYETRPVYGYDDCFPSVEPCTFPGTSHLAVRDHGELCWLRWDVATTQNRLDCRTRSQILPDLEFRRSLVFADASITWDFEVRNEGDTPTPFLHVTHALMPLDRVVALQLPRFAHVVDEARRQPLELEDPRQCADFLLARPQGTATMLLLRNLKDGRAAVAFDDGMVLQIEFSSALLPTLGIWWNNGGYPDEDGCRRVECALEPIPGTTSSLAESYADHVHLTALPKRSTTWQIAWKVKASQ